MSKHASCHTAPESLARLQEGFAAHIRDPHGAPAPEGVEDRRMAIYRELFFNNIVSFLSGNFPVLRSLYDDASWNRLCRDFYRDHRCATPLFPELPREFLKYLQEYQGARPGDAPFMLELAHYEWVELALSLDDRSLDDTPADPDGDLLHAAPVISPLAWPLSYRFPVHRIRADYQPDTAPDEMTHLLVWRQRDHAVRFMEMNPVSMLLVNKMKEASSATGLELLNEIVETIGHRNPETVIQGGKALLKDLRNKQVILGTRHP